ncbi:MAG: ABC transporter permease [Spirochaetales bacterium]|nr:ABC transporter permease [Spirochaetales bacterium]
MKNYIIRRILLMIPVLLGISIIIFSLIHLMPGNPYAYMIESDAAAEDVENMLESIGYYDPLPVQYVRWMGSLLKGDLGYSIKFKEPISEMISRRIGNTLMLSGVALILSIIIAIPLGVISATKQYSIFDYIATIVAFIGLSIPAFFFALLLVKFFAIDLKLFPISGMRTLASGFTGFRAFLDLLYHLALPVIVLSFIQMASFMRYTRTALLEVIQQDYIRTARAKGLREKIVIYKHALSNALIPVVTIISLSLGQLLSGAVLTETIFVWPGMGTLIFQAVMNRDYPVIMDATMVLAFMILMANLLADIMYALVDPRIRYT